MNKADSGHFGLDGTAIYCANSIIRDDLLSESICHEELQH